MTDYADRGVVEDAIEGWTDGQIVCRANNQHAWKPFTVQRGVGYLLITQRCTRCLNRRTAEMDNDGYMLTRWSIDYRTGYLLEGLGRVGPDGRAALRLATLRGLTITDMEYEDE